MYSIVKRYIGGKNGCNSKKTYVLTESIDQSVRSYYQYNPAVFLGELSDITDSDEENDARRVPVNEVIRPEIPPEILTKQREIIIHATEDPELNPAAAAEESEGNPALNPGVLPEEERVAVPRPDEPEPAAEERDGTYRII